MRIY